MTASSQTTSLTLPTSSCQYLVGSPKAMLSTVTVYGPAKSFITPSVVQMPVCPISGNNQLQGKVRSDHKISVNQINSLIFEIIEN